MTTTRKKTQTRQRQNGEWQGNGHDTEENKADGECARIFTPHHDEQKHLLQCVNHTVISSLVFICCTLAVFPLRVKLRWINSLQVCFCIWDLNLERAHSNNTCYLEEWLIWRRVWNQTASFPGLPDRQLKFQSTILADLLTTWELEITYLN